MKRFIPFLSVLLLAFTLMPQNLFAQAEYDNGGLLAYVNDYGRIRIYGTGVDAPQQIERISALIGGAQDQVFDYQMDADNESPAVVVDNPALSDWELFVSTNNAYSNLPPNYLLNINIYGWAESPFVLMKFTVTNREAAAIDAYLGFEIIPAIDGTYGGEVVTYNPDNQTVYFERTGTVPVIGIQIPSHDLVTLKSIDWYDAYYESDPDLFGWLTTGTVETTFDQCPNGPVTFMGLGTAHLEPAASTSFWVTVALAATTEAVNNWITDAQTRFAAILTSVEQIDEIPTQYALTQNYPNPFNPSTKINFSIPQNEFVKIKVYNSLGQQVAELVNEELSAGNYSVEFNAENLSSGVYMYTLNSGNYSLTKKMLLVK